MANVIKIKAGSGLPTTSDIVDRELAFDRSNNKLYINDSGIIVDLTGQAGGGPASTADRIEFTAQAGEALSKGDVVYISGLSGNTPVVSKADADDANKMPAFGLASSSASLNNSVDIVTFGVLESLDTSAFTQGDTLFVSTTPGGLTATKPTGETGLIQNIAYVVRSAASVGAVKIGGAGRTAATPNLNQDKIFLGNASNQAVSTALSSIGLSKFNNDSGFTTNTGDIEGVTAGTGLSGGGTSGTVTLSHADTSSQASVDNSGRTYIQDITLDTYGHVTAISSATETVTDTDTTYSAGSGLDLTGTTFSVDVSDFMSNGSDNRILTASGADGINAEANLTFGGTNLSIAAGGKLQVDEVEGKSNNTNTLLLNDDQTSANNQVSLQSINHINIMTDGNNNGTGNFKVWNGSYDVDTADIAFAVNSAGNTTVYGNLTINGTISGNAIKDEDNMASNSASHAATQQSIKAYVDAEVAGIVDSAPAALNTLDELAAALGDDANFATTTSTSLGNRLRVDTASQGLTGTQQANAITNLGITATKAELNYVDGVTSNIQTQLNGKLSTSGTAANSTLLGNLGQGSFLRSDANDTASGALTFTGRVTISDSGADGLHLNQDTGATTNSNRLFFTGSSTSAIMQEAGDLSFRTGATAGSSSGTERFKINTSGTHTVGNITVSGTVDGRDVASDGSKLDGIESGATADQSASEILTAIKTVDGSGSGLDADLLDGLHQSSFPRRGNLAENTASSITTFNSNAAINTSSGNQSGLQVYQATGGADAFMTFHVNGDYAVYFGLDGGTNDLAVGGWSRGANSYKVWHQGNDGSGSTLDADLLDGIQGASFLRSDADDTASGQYSFTKVNDHAIRVGTIRGTTVGSQSGEYIHMYNKVHIGSPSGWGSRSAPTYGLSTYGGADLATDTGDVTIGGNLKLTREKGLLWDYTPNTGHGGYIAHPGGGMYRTSTGSHTGALTITIPSGGGPADMISFWVDVFDYVSYESQSFYIAGYVYQTAGSNEWVNETAMMLTPKENHARTVRFGHNGTNHVVYIGELADTWSYPQVTVRNVQVGFNSDVDTYDDNWDISFEASAFANVDATYSGADTLLSAGKIKMADGAGKFVHNTTSSRDKIRVWNSSAYAIGMQSPNNYGGLVNQYAMTFSMDSTSNRGFLWVKNTHSQSQGAMALTTDGKATIAHSLRLGYGESDTTTPGGTYRLDVSGNSLVTGTMFASTLQTDSGNLNLSGGGWGMNFYIDTDANSGDNYNFYSDNALRHILGGDGNVTFGKVANPTLSIMNTATATGSGPTLEFGHDQGGGARAGAISTYLMDGSVANRTSLLRFWHTQANADILKLQLGDNYVRQYQKGDASDYLETIVNDDHAEFHVASGNYVKISTDSGYVNIGAQNPSWAHFYTDRPGWYFDKGPTSGNGVFQSYSGQDLDLRRAQSSHDRIVIEASAQNFIIDATTRMRLTSSGLDVLNNIYFGTGNIWQLDQGSWTGGSANQANIMLSGASGTFGIHSNSGNADLLVDGAIRSLSDVVAYYSDIRLKHKFEPITSALEKVQSLEGFTYESNELAKELGYNEAYDNLTGKRKVGVSAQQVQEVLPEAVTLAPFDTHKNEDGTIESKSGEDYLTVKYEKIVPLLIEAIKEQQQQINELKEKLNG